MAFGRQPKLGEQLARDIAAARVPYGMLAVWILGQESVAVKGGDTVLYIDPYLTPSPYRRVEPPLSAEQVSAETIFITHEHTDHLDGPTIAAIASTRPATRFMAPIYCRELLLEAGVVGDRILPAKTNEWWDGPGYRVLPVPAAHEELDATPERDHRFVGYIFELNGVTYYHAGDTTIYPGLVESLRERAIDLGMLPINGRDAFRTGRNIIGNMNYREAAELAVQAGFETVVPLHYDMFAGNSEHPGYFVDYLYDHYPTQKFHVMARYEKYVYVSERALS